MKPRWGMGNGGHAFLNIAPESGYMVAKYQRADESCIFGALMGHKTNNWIVDMAVLDFLNGMSH